MNHPRFERMTSLLLEFPRDRNTENSRLDGVHCLFGCAFLLAARASQA